jgi:hypothetical protein
MLAMESTGVYWKPVFYALESDFTCLLVNAADIKQVPGQCSLVRCRNSATLACAPTLLQEQQQPGECLLTFGFVVL